MYHLIFMVSSGYNATVICGQNQRHTCNIDCKGNGCSYLRLVCGSGNMNDASDQWIDWSLNDNDDGANCTFIVNCNNTDAWQSGNSNACANIGLDSNYSIWNVTWTELLPPNLVNGLYI